MAACFDQPISWSMSAMLRDIIVFIVVRAPTRNTASHDNHDKIMGFLFFPITNFQYTCFIAKWSSRFWFPGMSPKQISDEYLLKNVLCSRLFPVLFLGCVWPHLQTPQRECLEMCPVKISSIWHKFSIKT